MPTGKSLAARRPCRHGSACLGTPRGFTYVALLAILALLGASLAALGTAWTTAKQRENERELQFRGEQIRDAIGRYRASAAPPTWPPTLEALLEDRRGPEVRHHLRRLWADPFTGHADWELVDAPEGNGGGSARRIAGVRSRSEARRLSTAGAGAVDAENAKVSDWVFVHEPVAAPRRPASPSREPLP